MHRNGRSSPSQHGRSKEQGRKSSYTSSRIPQERRQSLLSREHAQVAAPPLPNDNRGGRYHGIGESSNLAASMTAGLPPRVVYDNSATSSSSAASEESDSRSSSPAPQLQSFISTDVASPMAVDSDIFQNSGYFDFIQNPFTNDTDTTQLSSQLNLANISSTASHDDAKSFSKANPTMRPIEPSLQSPTLKCIYGAETCMATALMIIQSLHTPPPVCLSAINMASPTGPDLSARGTDQVLSINRAAVESVSMMLSCHCSRSRQLQLVLTTICSKLTAWYLAMSRAENNQNAILDGRQGSDAGVPNRGGLADFNRSRSQSQLGNASGAIYGNTAERVTYHAITYGSFNLDTGLEKKIRAQLILNELHNLEHLIEALVRRIEEAEANNAGASRTRTIENTVDTAGIGSWQLDMASNAPNMHMNPMRPYGATSTAGTASSSAASIQGSIRTFLKRRLEAVMAESTMMLAA